jgi:hypothetical protein
VSDRNLGVPGWVTFDHPYRRDLEPRRVEHLQFGVTWDVTEILDSWQHHRPPEETLGKATLTKWWLLRVTGPLPGRPAESGEFVMEVSFHGDPADWWITVG